MSLEDNVAGGKLADETLKALVEIAGEAPAAQRQRFWEHLKELCHSQAHPPLPPSPTAKNLVAQIGQMIVPFGNSKGEKFCNAKISDLEWVQARLEDSQATLRLLNIYLSDPQVRAEREQCFGRR